MRIRLSICEEHIEGGCGQIQGGVARSWREETGESIDVPVVDAAEDAVNERAMRCKLHR